MARVPQQRRVCRLPACASFQPETQGAARPVRLAVEEYEALRLMDLEGLTQADCARHMGVARTTVQALYAAARRKVARMLVEGRGLTIAGGAYRVCPGPEGAVGCARRCVAAQPPERKESIMRIAVTYENGQVFQHFGHSEQFKLYDVTDGRVAAAQVADAGGSGHGALAGLLQGLGVDTLICGGIGPGARNALAEAGIALYAGVRGDADEAVAAFLAGSLAATDAATCDHHGQEHGADHHCGEHGCGGHGAGHSCGGHCGA